MYIISLILYNLIDNEKNFNSVNVIKMRNVNRQTWGA